MSITFVFPVLNVPIIFLVYVFFIGMAGNYQSLANDILEEGLREEELG